MEKYSTTTITRVVPQFFLELITTQLRFHMVSPQLVLLIILTMQSYKFYNYTVEILVFILILFLVYLSVLVFVLVLVKRYPTTSLGKSAVV